MPGWHVHPPNHSQNSQAIPVQRSQFPRGGRKGRGFRGGRAGYEEHQVYKHGQIKTVQMKSKDRDLASVYGYAGSNQRFGTSAPVSSSPFFALCSTAFPCSSFSGDGHICLDCSCTLAYILLFPSALGISLHFLYANQHILALSHCDWAYFCLLLLEYGISFAVHFKHGHLLFYAFRGGVIDVQAVSIYSNAG